MDVHSPQLLKTSTVELQAFEAWRDEPDVNEGDVGELAAPFSGDADSTAEGHHQVAEFLAAVEAFVGVAPHAVHGVVGFWLSQDIFERDLTKKSKSFKSDASQYSIDFMELMYFCKL